MMTAKLRKFRQNGQKKEALRVGTLRFIFPLVDYFTISSNSTSKIRVE